MRVPAAPLRQAPEDLLQNVDACSSPFRRLRFCHFTLCWRHAHAREVDLHNLTHNFKFLSFCRNLKTVGPASCDNVDGADVQGLEALQQLPQLRRLKFSCHQPDAEVLMIASVTQLTALDVAASAQGALISRLRAPMRAAASESLRLLAKTTFVVSDQADFLSESCVA